MKIQRSECKLLIICRQLHFLREKERELTSRAIVAKIRNLHCLYYNLVLRRAVVEGMVNVLCEYVRYRADEIRGLRWEVYRQIIVIVTDSDSDMVDDEDSSEVDELFLWWEAIFQTTLLTPNNSLEGYLCWCHWQTNSSFALKESQLSAHCNCSRHC